MGNKLAKVKADSHEPRDEREVSDTVKIQVGTNSAKIEALEKKVEKFDVFEIKLSVMSNEMGNLRQEVIKNNTDTNSRLASFEKKIVDVVGKIEEKMTTDKKDNKARFRWMVGIAVAILLAIPSTLNYGLGYMKQMNVAIVKEREKTQSAIEAINSVKDSLVISALIKVQSSVENLNNKIDGLHIK